MQAEPNGEPQQICLPPQSARLEHSNALAVSVEAAEATHFVRPKVGEFRDELATSRSQMGVSPEHFSAPQLTDFGPSQTQRCEWAYESQRPPQWKPFGHSAEPGKHTTVASHFSGASHHVRSGPRPPWPQQTSPLPQSDASSQARSHLSGPEHSSDPWPTHRCCEGSPASGPWSGAKSTQQRSALEQRAGRPVRSSPGNTHGTPGPASATPPASNPLATGGVLPLVTVGAEVSGGVDATLTPVSYTHLTLPTSDLV